MRRRIVGAVFLPLVLLNAGCGAGAAGEAATTPPPAVTPLPSSGPTSGSSPSGAGAGEADPGTTQITDDLATGRVRHVIRSSGVTATVEYETRMPHVPWTAGGDKPLRVEVKVSRPKKKVYLNRVTLRFLVDDGTGANPGPEPLVDTSSNITPGFLVAPPYSYVQAFAVPVVDPSSVAMTIDVKLELVSLVDAKSKDYTKQTVTDTLTTVIT